MMVTKKENDDALKAVDADKQKIQAAMDKAKADKEKLETPLSAALKAM